MLLEKKLIKKNISLITKGVGAIGGEVKFKTDALSGGIGSIERMQKDFDSGCS